MLVKICNNVYDSNEVPIMLVLDDNARHLIADMGDRTKLALFPDTKQYKSIDKRVSFMELPTAADYDDDALKCSDFDCPYNNNGECIAYLYGNVDCNNPDYLNWFVDNHDTVE